MLFPVVLLLGLNGLLVGILQSYDRFAIAAISPLVWNVVIIVLFVVLRPHFHGDHGDLRLRGRDPRRDGRAAADGRRRRCSRSTSGSAFTIDWHDPRVRQVFVLMLPVTIGLGIVNLDQLINSVFGTLVNRRAPSAINYAFRVYMLPQGMFSVAVATVLFPTLSRQAARRDAGGMRRALGDRHAPDQPAADPGRGVPDGARDAGRAADLPARRSSPRSRPT